MFKDYYSILEIQYPSSAEEIKSVFKSQALKWHPDRNPKQDTTKKMQEINEAYLILKDEEAKHRYDIEYQRFQKASKSSNSFNTGSRNNKENHQEANKSSHSSSNYKKQTNQNRDSSFKNYEMEDDVLKRWMENAKEQSISLAEQMIKDLKGMAKAGATAAAKEVTYQFFIQIIIGFLFLFIFALSKGCN